MSAQPAKAKQASRWGNFLSGAVEGLESRLDKILAEDNNRAAKQLPPRQTVVEKVAAEQSEGALKKDSDADSDAGTSLEGDKTSVAGDKVSSASLRPSSLRAHSNSPAPSEPKARTSFESTVSSAVDGSKTNAEDIVAGVDGSAFVERSNRTAEDIAIRTEHVADGDGLEHVNDASITSTQDAKIEGHMEEDASPAEYRAQIAQLRQDLEKAELARQEEVHAQMERIDALNSKLQYMTKEAVESAQRAAADAPSGSLEKKLAAKDEQIALLMEEGQTLSKTEVNYSATIKKLRMKMNDDAKVATDMKRKLDNAERASSSMTERIARLEANQKESTSRLLRIPRLEREVEELKAERDSKQTVIENLRNQVKEASVKLEEEGKKANEEALENERKTVRSLQDDLANAKIERQLAEDRMKAEARASKETAEKDQEKASATEHGLRNEISILEGRMEVFRARTEEVSSGTSGDAQAKLMRQIETLQSQYAVASENWQGIESSMEARITALEKERDDAAKQETEARRKTREMSSQSRKFETQVDELSRKCQVLEHELKEQRAEADKVQKRAAEFEKQLRDAQAAHEKERNALSETLATKIEEEKQRWKQESNQFGLETPLTGPTDSPLALSRKTSGLELPLPMRKNPSRLRSTELGIPEYEKSHSRRSSSMMVPRGGEIGSPGAYVTSPGVIESGFSTPMFNGHIPQTPSAPGGDDDEIETGSSPQRTVNDMISASTVGAGPSVQLVERMSAAVRRLESDKAASKDELARITAQRDESRREVVSLMREVEAKRASQADFKKLEADMAEMTERYQTTLEMLGEKSERVEELTADVADLKKIMRELVESTVK